MLLCYYKRAPSKTPRNRTTERFSVAKKILLQMKKLLDKRTQL